MKFCVTNNFLAVPFLNPTSTVDAPCNYQSETKITREIKITPRIYNREPSQTRTGNILGCECTYTVTEEFSHLNEKLFDGLSSNTTLYIISEEGRTNLGHVLLGLE